VATQKEYSYWASPEGVFLLGKPRRSIPTGQAQKVKSLIGFKTGALEGKTSVFGLPSSVSNTT